MSSAPKFITIRGYAIAFDRPVHVADEGHEVVDRKAFDAMLSPKNRRVPVRWLDHDDTAQQVASDVHLFADDYGLGFSATLDVRSKAGRLNANWGVLSAMTRAAKPLDQCSVGEFEIAESATENVQGMSCRRIVEAKIGHITICDNAAYGRLTAVWRADVDLSAAPWRIQQMAARWEFGNELAGMEAKKRRVVAQADAILRAPGEGLAGDLSAAQAAAIDAKIRDAQVIQRQIVAFKAGGFAV